MNTGELFISRGMRLEASGLPVSGIVYTSRADFYEHDTETDLPLVSEKSGEVDSSVQFNLIPEPEKRNSASFQSRRVITTFPLPETFAPVRTDPRKVWTRESTRVRFPQR